MDCHRQTTGAATGGVLRAAVALSVASLIRISAVLAIAVLLILPAARAATAEEEAIAAAKKAEKAAYEARKAAFRVQEIAPGELPTVNTQVLARIGDFSTRGIPWDDPVPELWFPVGEVVHYDIQWGVFTVGEAVAQAQWLRLGDRRFLALTMTAKSNGIVEMLYPVTEFMQTLLDPATFLPLSFEKQSSEGRHKTWDITTFDHAKRTGRWESLLRLNPQDFPIEPDTRDLMGLMYWIRKEPVKADETRTYRVMTDEKLYEMILEAGKKETLDIGKPYGKVATVKMEPKGKFNGLFIRKGRMFVWVSDDARCTLCRVTASVPVASIKVLLRSVEGPGTDGWITRNPANQKANP